MPYANVVFVKLLWKELLLDDQRFSNLSDDQKGLYLMLLLLAGATSNNIPSDENYIKRALNLSQSAEIVAENRDCLLSIFPKLIRKDGYLKFKKFKHLNNYIRQSKNKSDDDEMGSPKVEKNRIDKIREEYTSLKHLSLTDFDTSDYARTTKAIKILAIKPGGDDGLIIDGLKWCAKQNWCDWTLETLIRRWADFKANRNNKPENTRAML